MLDCIDIAVSQPAAMQENALYGLTTGGQALPIADGISLSPVMPEALPLMDDILLDRPGNRVVSQLDSLPPPTELPVHIYAQTSLDVLMLKCATVNSFCLGRLGNDRYAEIHTGMNRTMALFEDGAQLAEKVCGHLPGFESQRFDQELVAARRPGTASYSCVQARLDGSTTCPAGGCPLPDGKIATAPLDLLSWDCNSKHIPEKTLAQSVVASEFRHGLLNVQGNLHAYDDGVYKEVSPDDLIGKILPHLGMEGNVSYASRIGRLIQLGYARSVASITPDAAFICFLNGTLNIASRSLEAHDQRHMLLNRIPHDYVPDATCPRFIAFLNSIWRPDTDRQQKISFIQQWIGYLLTADTSMQKMLILLGRGANGKSVMEEVIRQVVGEANTANAMLGRLRAPYVRATMEGKLLNVSSDLPKERIAADGDLKAIIAGDVIEASLKYKPSRSIRPFVRFMVGTNNLPDCNDTSDGYFRRLVILQFNRRFDAAERNTNLVEELTAEAPGIIAWALQGLYTLHEQGSFVDLPSSNTAVEEYKDDISPVRLFADECLAPSNTRSGYMSKDLYLAFRAWCRDRGFDPGDVRSLGVELGALGFSSRKVNTTIWLVRAKDAAQEYFRPGLVDVGGALPA